MSDSRSPRTSPPPGAAGTSFAGWARVFAVGPALSLLLVFGCARSTPDPVAVLEEATEAIGAAGDLTYDFTYQGHGSMAGQLSGQVKIMKSDQPGQGRLWVSMQVPETHGGSDNPAELRIALRGQDIQALDERRRTLSQGTVDGGSAHLMSYAYYGVLFQLLQPQPFAVELQDSLIAYTGVEDVDGVKCDAVKAANNTYGGADITWLIGRDDRLPHGQRWDVTTPGVDGGFIFEISNLDPQAELADFDFEIEAPDGYAIVDENARSVSLRSEAPDWTLTSLDGETVRLSALRGQVVVLDFWASWCLPCWQLMPEFDTVSKSFAGRPVRFFGVNSWESPAVDPAEYMAEKSIAYDVLTAGESIAADYKIGTLPALFVIDREGRIAYANNPVARSPVVVGGELRQAIETALR